MAESEKITSVGALLALPENTLIEDVTGARYWKYSSGKETSNINWITWVSVDKQNHHTDEIVLPATVIGGNA